MFAAGERQHRHCPRAQRRYGEPKQLFPQTHSVRSLIEIVALRYKV
jgi:hypothetical protein